MLKALARLDITRDDLSIGLNYACAVLGIGSLAMGRNMGQIGLVPGFLTLIAMFLINLYATTRLSKTLLQTPPSVVTFSDLGGYVGGTFGRYLVLFTQFGACLIIPIAFLVLGGATLIPILLEDVWPNGGDPNVYIPVMAAVLLPVVLIRSLKEAAWAAFLGTAGAFFGDIFAIIDSLGNSPYYVDTQPKVEVLPIISVFGSLVMAFGGAVVVPALQREHPRPERMPMILGVVMGIIAFIYALIGLQGYFQYGCVAPQNLLMAMTDRTWELLAMAFFLLHIVLAYTVYLNPALFLFERFCFGMHQVDDRKAADYAPEYHLTADNTAECKEGAPVPRQVFKPLTMTERIKSYTLRTTVVVIQVFLAMLLQGCFDDLCDFIGASTIALSCVILPIYVYLKMFGSKMSKLERAFAKSLMVIIIALSIYTSYKYMATIVENASKYAAFESRPVLSPSIQLQRDGPRTLETRYCAASPYAA